LFAQNAARGTVPGAGRARRMSESDKVGQLRSSTVNNIGPRQGPSARRRAVSESISVPHKPHYAGNQGTKPVRS